MVVFSLTPVSLGFMRPGFKRFPGPKAHETHSADKWLCKHSNQVAEKKTTKWQGLFSPHPKQQKFLNPSTVWFSTSYSVLISSIIFSSIFFLHISVHLHILCFSLCFVAAAQSLIFSIIHVWFISLNFSGPLAFMFGKRNTSYNKNIRQNICHGRFFNKARTSFSRHTPLSQGLFSSPLPLPSSPCPLSSRVICSVSCLPLLAFPLHLWLVNLCTSLIGQSFQHLPVLTVMKTSPPSFEDTPSFSEDDPLLWLSASS